MSYFDNELLMCYETGTDTHKLSYRVDSFHVMVLTNPTTHQENHLRPSVDTQKQQKEFWKPKELLTRTSSPPDL